MTTPATLTPSQAAFKFLNDLFLDPVLLAAYAEKCWSLNGAKNTDEILTGWMGKLGYPGATPALVYAALQFWQCEGLWLWQGEYNQNFYYPPDSESQANQYTLKILPNAGEIQVTLNGEILSYSLSADKGYLTLYWEQENGNSSNGSIVFYYSPSFSLDADTAVEYAGNFFNGYLNGNPFKGALLSQSSEDDEDNQDQNDSNFPGAVVWPVVSCIGLGALVGGGYLVYAPRIRLKSEALKTYKNLNKDFSVQKELDKLSDVVAKNRIYEGLPEERPLYPEKPFRQPLYPKRGQPVPRKPVRQLQSIREEEGEESLSPPSSADIYEQLNRSQELSENFQSNPGTSYLELSMEKSLSNVDDQLRNLNDEDEFDPEKIVGEFEGDLLEDGAGA